MRSSISVPKTIDLYEHFPIRSHHYGKTHLRHHFLERKKKENNASNTLTLFNTPLLLVEVHMGPTKFICDPRSLGEHVYFNQ